MTAYMGVGSGGRKMTIKDMEDAMTAPGRRPVVSWMTDTLDTIEHGAGDTPQDFILRNLMLKELREAGREEEADFLDEEFEARHPNWEKIFHSFEIVYPQEFTNVRVLRDFATNYTWEKEPIHAITEALCEMDIPRHATIWSNRYGIDLFRTLRKKLPSILRYRMSRCEQKTWMEVMTELQQCWDTLAEDRVVASQTVREGKRPAAVPPAYTYACSTYPSSPAFRKFKEDLEDQQPVEPRTWEDDCSRSNGKQLLLKMIAMTQRKDYIGNEEFKFTFNDSKKDFSIKAHPTPNQPGNGKIQEYGGYDEMLDNLSAYTVLSPESFKRYYKRFLSSSLDACSRSDGPYFRIWQLSVMVTFEIARRVNDTSGCTYYDLPVAYGIAAAVKVAESFNEMVNMFRYGRASRQGAIDTLIERFHVKYGCIDDWTRSLFEVPTDGGLQRGIMKLTL